jgi:hypothetical protein
MRAHGCRRLLIYCSDRLYCHHGAKVDADRWPDDDGQGMELNRWLCRARPI